MKIASVPSAVNGPVNISPAAINLHIGFIHVPRSKIGVVKPVPANSQQDDVTLKMTTVEWVHAMLHQEKRMKSVSPPTICNSAILTPFS